jgi:hypothetical protein
MVLGHRYARMLWRNYLTAQVLAVPITPFMLFTLVDGWLGDDIGRFLVEVAICLVCYGAIVFNFTRVEREIAREIVAHLRSGGLQVSSAPRFTPAAFAFWREYEGVSLELLR